MKVMGDKKQENTYGIELEEVSEFPEKVSISEETDPLETEDILEDMPDATFEEITDLEEKASNNIEIADGFIEGTSTEDEVDILNLTSQIDQLNDIDDNQEKKTVTQQFTDEDVKKTESAEQHKDDTTGIHIEDHDSEGMYFDDERNEFIIEDLPDSSLEDVEYSDESRSSKIKSSQEEHKVEEKVDKDKLTIDIPEEFRNKLYENMEIDNFDSIDLNEAEEIANEDILFLNEDDLVEELEDFELTPLEKNESPAGTIRESFTKESSEIDENSEEREREEEVHDEMDFIQEEVIEEPVTNENIANVQEEDREVLSSTEPHEPVHDAEDADRAEKAEEHEEITGLNDEDTSPVEAELPDEISDAGITDEDMEYDKGSAYVPGNNVPIEPPGVVEKIPHGLEMTGGSADQFRIVDDEMVDREYDETVSVFEEDSLDRISSGIIEVIEGEAKILKEADPTRDEEKIAYIMKGTLPTFEDLLIDFEEEFKFKDDDVIFIDNAFMADDYDKYLHEIDEYYEQKKKKGITPAVELLGLTRDELNFFEGSVFEKEYESINVADQFGVDQVGMDQAGEDFDIVKDISYFIADPQSLTEREKKSIEEDVESEGAVVFEENVDDIVSRLKTMDPNYSKDDYTIAEKAEEKKAVSGDDVISEKTEKHVSAKDEALDISDKVVILDNKDDLNRFVDTMPVEKQENIRKLMAYLDNLFEELPEDVIKNFANSEYFDLYVKVLNDLGI